MLRVGVKIRITVSVGVMVRVMTYGTFPRPFRLRPLRLRPFRLHRVTPLA